jgi:hypothetical protein
MTRPAIRALADRLEQQLPPTAERPTDLHDCLDGLLPAQPDLADTLRDTIHDEVIGPLATFDALSELLDRHALPTARREEVAAARRRPRQTVERLQRRCQELARSGLAPATPPHLAAPPPAGRERRRGGADQPEPVRAIKVEPAADRRKREVGDDAEQWALAAALAALLDLDPAARNAAIDQLAADLQRSFTGPTVDELVGNARLATIASDQEAFIEHASDFLHVSRLSDAFGFDLLAWLPLTEDDAPATRLVEVKSTAGGAFHLSTGEWTCARRFHDADEGDRYAVLTITRNPKGGAPTSMDLLPDPVRLVDEGNLEQTVDGYRMRYTT